MYLRLLAVLPLLVTAISLALSAMAAAGPCPPIDC